MTSRIEARRLEPDAPMDGGLRKRAARRGRTSGDTLARGAPASKRADRDTSVILRAGVGATGGGGDPAAPTTHDPVKAARAERAAERVRVVAWATALPPAELVPVIRSLHRERRGLQQAAGDMERRIKAEHRWAAAQRVMAVGGEVRGRFPPVMPEDEALVRLTRASFFAVRDHAQGQLDACERRLLALAARLPAAAWVEATRGAGMRSLAAIVGEAGDLSGYANPAKLWKRMGLAVIDGRAQRRVAMPRGADAKARAKALEEIARQGDSPRRRAIMHDVAVKLVMAGGEYADLYRTRKAYEAERAPDMAKNHAHKRALRYAAKRLLRDLWRAWRAAAGDLAAAAPEWRAS